MKKKLLEKDGFYLALFICVCFVAVGGVWITSNRVEKLASNNELLNEKDDELHLIGIEKDDAIPTNTDSDQNIEKAKEKAEETNTTKVSKLDFLGNRVIREYSEKEPSYSKTLDVWEIHKGLDISAELGKEVKSLLEGTVASVYQDDKYGVSIKVSYSNDISVVYSNLNKDVLVKKGDKVKEGQSIGKVGATSVDAIDGEPHVHIQAFKGKDLIDPMSLIQ